MMERVNWLSGEWRIQGELRGSLGYWGVSKDCSSQRMGFSMSERWEGDELSDE